MSLPSYVNRSGEQVYLPPFAATGTRLFGFAVSASLDAQKTRICNPCLNAPLGGKQRFLPVLDQVFFVFNSIDALRSTAPGWENTGSFTEQEGAVWMLVADTETDRMFWYHPYMLVDNAYALSMGREIYGFPKSLGWFELAPGPDAPDVLSVETIGVRQWGPDAKGERQPLFTVRRIDGPAFPGEGVLEGISEASQLMAELVKLSSLDLSWLEELKLSAHFLEDVLNLRLPMVFLKQFRDGLAPSQAVAQCIQEVNVQLTAFHGARIYGDAFEVVVHDMDSHPIRADLGLPNGPIPVNYAFWTCFDFTIGPCTAAWKVSP